MIYTVNGMWKLTGDFTRVRVVAANRRDAWRAAERVGLIPTGIRPGAGRGAEHVIDAGPGWQDRRPPRSRSRHPGEDRSGNR